MKLFKTIVILILLINLKASARAAAPYPCELGFNVGGSIPRGTTDLSAGSVTLEETLKASARFEGSLFCQTQDTVQWGLEAGYSASHTIANNLMPSSRYVYTNDSRVRILNVGPAARVGLWIEEGSIAFRPYAVGGWYWNRFWKNGRVVSTDGSSASGQGVVNKASEDHLGLSTGVGIEFRVFKNMMLGAEVRYFRIFNGNDDGEFIVPTARFAILF